MVEYLALCTAALAAMFMLAGRRRRARLYKALRTPSPGIVRGLRVIGPVAALGAGTGSMFLIWAGLFAPGVAWGYALLGLITLALTMLLFIPGRWPR